MQVTRRRLITGLVALVAAPALVRASSLMPVRVWAAPRIVGDGIHDDWPGLQAAANDEPFISNGLVSRSAGKISGALTIRGGTYRLSQAVAIPCVADIRDCAFTSVHQFDSTLAVLDFRAPLTVTNASL